MTKSMESLLSDELTIKVKYVSIVLYIKLIFHPTVKKGHLYFSICNIFEYYALTLVYISFVGLN